MCHEDCRTAEIQRESVEAKRHASGVATVTGVDNTAASVGVEKRVVEDSVVTVEHVQHCLCEISGEGGDSL